MEVNCSKQCLEGKSCLPSEDKNGGRGYDDFLDSLGWYIAEICEEMWI